MLFFFSLVLMDSIGTILYIIHSSLLSVSAVKILFRDSGYPAAVVEWTIEDHRVAGFTHALLVFARADEDAEQAKFGLALVDEEESRTAVALFWEISLLCKRTQI